MSNYFDNQDEWCWKISGDKALVITDHGNHTHTLDVTDVPIGEMVDHTGRVMGDAHRSVPHDFKEDNNLKETMNNNISEENTMENATVDDNLQTAETEETLDSSEDMGEGCEDGLDM